MNSNPKIISVHSGKGGVGKTTIVANLGAQLAREARTLLIDADFFTRGMSFLLTRDEGSPELGLAAVLESLSETSSMSEFPTNLHGLLDEGELWEVKPNLFLLPPTTGRASDMMHSDIVSTRIYRALANTRDKGDAFRVAFHKYFEDFSFVLIDCRSGVDEVSIAPAFLADEFWVVTEEDNTSIRATNFLLDGIEKYSSQSDTVHTETRFGGFIVNMIVSPRPDFLARSLQRIFSGRCLAVMPLSRGARQAFIHDELVSETHPSNPVSREVRALCLHVLGKEKEGAVARFSRRARNDAFRRWVFGGVLFSTPLVAASILLIGGVIDPDFYVAGWIVGLMFGLAGVAAGGMSALFYLRGR